MDKPKRPNWYGPVYGNQEERDICWIQVERKPKEKKNNSVSLFPKNENENILLYPRFNIDQSMESAKNTYSLQNQPTFKILETFEKDPKSTSDTITNSIAKNQTTIKTV